jgi:hypothetical protein
MSSLVATNQREGNGTSGKLDAYFDTSASPYVDQDQVFYATQTDTSGGGSNYLQTDAGGTHSGRTNGPFGGAGLGVSDPAVVSDGAGITIQRHKYVNADPAVGPPITQIGWNQGAAGAADHSSGEIGWLLRGGLWTSTIDSGFTSFLSIVGSPATFPITLAIAHAALTSKQFLMVCAWAAEITSLGHTPANAAWSFATDQPSRLVTLSDTQTWIGSLGSMSAGLFSGYALPTTDPSQTISIDVSGGGDVDSEGGIAWAIVEMDTDFVTSSPGFGFEDSTPAFVSL